MIKPGSLFKCVGLAHFYPIKSSTAGVERLIDAWVVIIDTIPNSNEEILVLTSNGLRWVFFERFRNGTKRF